MTSPLFYYLQEAMRGKASITRLSQVTPFLSFSLHSNNAAGGGEGDADKPSNNCAYLAAFPFTRGTIRCEMLAIVPGKRIAMIGKMLRSEAESLRRRQPLLMIAPSQCSSFEKLLEVCFSDWRVFLLFFFATIVNSSSISGIYSVMRIQESSYIDMITRF